MRYMILFNARGPRDKLEPGDTFVTALGDTDAVHAEFGPMPPEGGIPIVTLERIRAIIDRTSDKRALLPGDVIELGDYLYLYDGHPAVGGFVPLVRPESIEIVQRGR